MKKMCKGLAVVLAAVLMLTVCMPATAAAYDEDMEEIDSISVYVKPLLEGNYLYHGESRASVKPGQGYFIGCDDYGNDNADWYEFDETKDLKYDPEASLNGEEIQGGKAYVLVISFAPAMDCDFTENTKTPVPEGCDEVLGSELAEEGRGMTVRYKFTAEKWLSLGLTPASLDFGTVAPEYEVPEAKQVKVTNTGHAIVMIERPEELDAFDMTIVEGDSPVLEPGDSMTFAIVPKADLPEGEYKETLSFYGNEYRICVCGIGTDGEEEVPAADTQADLAISFKVETPKPVTPAAPATGDSGNTQLWALLGLVTLGGAVFLISRKNRVRG